MPVGVLQGLGDLGDQTGRLAEAGPTRQQVRQGQADDEVADQVGQALVSRDVGFAPSDAQKGSDCDFRHLFLRRLTSRAMIRSRVSSFAGNCLTTSPC